MATRPLPASALLFSAALLTAAMTPSVRADASVTASLAAYSVLGIVTSVGLHTALYGSPSIGLVRAIDQSGTSTQVTVHHKATDEPYALTIPKDALAGKEVRIGDTVEVTPNEAGLTIRLAEADVTVFAPRPEHAGLLHHERIGAAR